MPRAFWFLLVGALINRAGSFVVPLFAIYLTGERGLRPIVAGGIISAYGMGSLLSGPLGGALADGIGRRPTMLLAFGWSAVAMLLMPQAHAPLAIAAASFHLGLAGDLYRPAVQAAVADLCPSEQRARAYGLLYWVVNLGFAIAAALGGALAHRGFRWLFIADAGTTLCFALVIAVFVPETRPTIAATAPGAPREQGGFIEPLRDRVLVAFVLTQALVGVQFLQSHGALPIALAARGIGASRYGLVIGLNGLLIVLFQPAALGLVARMRRTQALALGAILVGVGFGINAPPLGLAGASLSVAVWTLGELIFSPVVPTVLADLAPASQRARYQGVGQMSYGLCALVGPPAGMWVLQHGSQTWLWGGCLALGLLAAALHLQSAPRLQARLGDRGRPA